MTDAISLPALDGRSALGFLAACGAHRLLCDELGLDARLAWSVDDASARLAVPGSTTVDDIVRLLADVVESLDDGQLLPGAPVGFPPGGGGSDPIRKPRADLRVAVSEWSGQLGADLMERWIPAMVTDLAVDQKGRCAHTLLAAPSGQQKFNTMFAKSLAEVRREPELRLREALVAWRRVAGVTGEYLDHRVLRSAADDSHGRTGEESGVPGATWLALMAMPWFVVGGDGKNRTGPAWQTLGRTSHLVWPLWEPLLDESAVRVLLGHDALQLVSVDGRLRAVDARRAQALGVFSISAARRAPIEGRKSAGVLVPRAVDLEVRS